MYNVEYFIFESAEKRKHMHAGYEPQLCANLQTQFSRNDAHVRKSTIILYRRYVAASHASFALGFFVVRAD